MSLSDAQLEVIKNELEKGEKLIPFIMKEQGFEGIITEVRQQLFSKYTQETIMGLIQTIRENNQPEIVEPTTEEKIAEIDRTLEMMTERRSKLEKEKQELQAQL